MSILDIFSKRQKRLKGEYPDVYKYDEFPQALRIQIIHILQATLGHRYDDRDRKIFETIHRGLAKEYGVFQLSKERDDFDAVCEYFMTTQDIAHCLDIVELAFRVISHEVAINYQYYKGAFESTQEPSDALKELNERFREAGIGYVFQSGEIIRVDSEFIHSEVVKPVLSLLGKAPKFAGANDEFLTAHEHYRHGRYKECLVYCLKAFESTMKSICHKRKWHYEPTETAQKLINLCFTNNLIPEYLQSHLGGLRSALESGVPTLRNKEGGHGQGAEVVELPQHYASYCLHLTASNILFLINIESAKKK